MIFKGLTITRSWDNKLAGNISIDTKSNDSIRLNLTEDLCQKLVDACADNIVEVATEAAQTMKANILEGVIQNKIEKITQC